MTTLKFLPGFVYSPFKYVYIFIIKKYLRDFPSGLVVRTQHFHYQGLGWIPGQEIKIL